MDDKSQSPLSHFAHLADANVGDESDPNCAPRQLRVKVFGHDEPLMDSELRSAA